MGVEDLIIDDQSYLEDDEDCSQFIEDAIHFQRTHDAEWYMKPFWAFIELCTVLFGMVFIFIIFVFGGVSAIVMTIIITPMFVLLNIITCFKPCQWIYDYFKESSPNTVIPDVV